MKKIFIAAASLLFLHVNAYAEEVRLSTDEIKTLMDGKTISGVHYGKKTSQYFSNSGLTLWISEGDDAPAEGQWKVEGDQYCSNFGSDWGCLDIVLDKAQDIYYFLGEDFRAPFVVSKGFKLHF